MAKTYRQLPKTLVFSTESFKKPSFKEREKDRKDQSADLSLELEKLRVRDIKWRVRRRGPVTWTAYLLLFLQNAFVMYLIWYPMSTNKEMPLAYYQLMIVLIGATLAESAYVIQLIVKWLFTEISYTNPSPEPEKEDP